MYNFPHKRQGLLVAITSIMAIFAIIVVLVAGFFIVYSRSHVNGLSMLPTLNAELDTTNDRDVVYINRFADIDKGDIVVLDLRKNSNFSGYTIKRLIATGGDIVNITYNSKTIEYDLTVNGKVVYSKPHKAFGNNTYNSFVQYVNNHNQDTTRIRYDLNGDLEGVVIKPNEIFVLGDNWDLSKDSSAVGPFKQSTIVGRVDIVVKPSQNELWQVLKRIF